MIVWVQSAHATDQEVNVLRQDVLIVFQIVQVRKKINVIILKWCEISTSWFELGDQRSHLQG